MKGIVFNLFEEVVRRSYGEDVWDELLLAAKLPGAYTSLDSYDDRDFFRLAGSASDQLNMPTYDVVRWFGREALPLLAQKYPGLFERHSNTRSFVLALNDIIHPEVRKLYPGANVPAFMYDTSSPEVLGMTYQSPRKLCAFAEGLVEGAAMHYRETVLFEQPRCMHRGDDSCAFRISFAPNVS
jgi:hypothetical protein